MNFQNRKYQLLTEKFEKKGQKIVSHQSGYLNLDVGEGRLPRVGEPEQYPQDYVGDVTEAIAYVQRIAETYPDEFAQWAAGSDILNKVGGNSVRKAGINRGGQTQDSLVYPANAESSQSGSRKTITTDELSNDVQLKRLVDSAKELLEQHRMAEGHLKAKILHVSKLQFYDSNAL
jgi:hypothetical protein